jgi:hypothetical protein
MPHCVHLRPKPLQFTPKARSTTPRTARSIKGPDTSRPTPSVNGPIVGIPEIWISDATVYGIPVVVELAKLLTNLQKTAIPFGFITRLDKDGTSAISRLVHAELMNALSR